MSFIVGHLCKVTVYYLLQDIFPPGAIQNIAQKWGSRVLQMDYDILKYTHDTGIGILLGKSISIGTYQALIGFVHFKQPINFRAIGRMSDLCCMENASIHKTY